MRLWLAVNDQRLEEAAERLPDCVVLGAVRTTAAWLEAAGRASTAGVVWLASRYLPGHPPLAGCLARLPPGTPVLLLTGRRDRVGRKLARACLVLAHGRALAGRTLDARALRRALGTLRACTETSSPAPGTRRLETRREGAGPDGARRR